MFSDLIERIWFAENHEEPVELILPPHQYVNLILPLCSSAYKYENVIIDEPQVEGISLKDTLLTYSSTTKLVGVRFYAFGSYPFLHLSGKQIINKSIHFIMASDKLKEIGTKSLNEPEHLIIQKIYDLLKVLFNIRAYEDIKLLMNFYKYYRWNDETSSIEDFCRNNETNYTTLNRKFLEVIGISPKKFERLLKFRKSLCGLIDSEENFTSISANSGYFDQAHFIREFKLFLNHTPKSYQALIKMADKESKIINYNFRLL